MYVDFQEIVIVPWDQVSDVDVKSLLYIYNIYNIHHRRSHHVTEM